jgi:hypothetical protein
MNLRQAKVIVFEYAKHKKDFTRRDANNLINEAHEAACEKMDFFERNALLNNADKLTRTIPELGNKGSLELLAVLSEYLPESREE